MCKSVKLLLLYLTLHSSFVQSSKVDDDVTEQLDHFGKANVLVQCSAQPETEELDLIHETVESIRNMVDSSTDTRTRIGGAALTALINQYQALVLQALQEIITFLNNNGISFKIFWIPFIIYIPDATWFVINNLVGINVVVAISLDKVIPIITPTSPSPPPPPPPETGNIPWNLKLTNTRCNKIRKKGDGVVVAILDTGVLWNHQELEHNFRNNDYSWWDTQEPATSKLPRDVAGHGTHVAGSAVGATVGVAPNAKWIACLGCLEHGCPLSIVYECMEYVACPWRWNDTSVDKASKDAAQRPDVVNMSLGSEGGSQVPYPSYDPQFKYIAYWNMLGIVSTIAAGNSGPDCGSMGYPASFYNAFAIASVDANATIAYYSARGPVLSAERPFRNSSNWEGASVFVPPSLVNCTNSTLGQTRIWQIIKPDVGAPGSQINSSWFTGVKDYMVLDGTSMAAPHVAGVMALVISENPNYKWNATEMNNLLRRTTTQDKDQLHGVGPNVTPGSFAKGSNILCNFWTSGQCDKWPNNVYGKGLVNACKAVEEAKKKI